MEGRSWGLGSVLLVTLVVGCAANTDSTTPSTIPSTNPATESTTVDTAAPADDDLFGEGQRTVDTAGPATTDLSADTTSSTTSTTTTSTTTTSTTTTTVAPVSATNPCPPTGAQVWEVRPASDIPAPAVPGDWRTESAGTSVQGRDLTVLVRPRDEPARTVLVIGGIHGNEPVSPPMVRAMVDVAIPDDTEVWLLPLMNPDGSAAGTRCNANGVDLNRNFSWDWRPSTGGPAAFSEPEPTAAAALVERVNPDLVIWVHQPLGYISSIGDTPDSYEQAWANAAGLPVRPDVTQHGGGESWTAFVAGVPSMLIEANTWEATPEMVAAHVAGFAALLDVVVPR